MKTSSFKLSVTIGAKPNETEKKNHRSGWKEFVFHPLKSHFST